MKNVVVLVPIYKAELNLLEMYSLNYSLDILKGRTVVFIGPESLDRSFYSERYKVIPFDSFDAPCFESVEEYNRLLLTPSFYERYSDYEFVLILQTDAIILRDELDYWCAQPFDYIGAPWPDGFELFVNLGLFEGEYGKHVKVAVGNGGLSLRRVRKCISLLKEFEVAINVFDSTGSSEDIFFSVMASLSNDFIVPNEITASRFSLELRPSYYFHVNGGQMPMGGHAWWRHEPEFWQAYLRETLL
ncbi:MAG: hypothetical protein HY847_00340 [Betaproteobacteria bacterium]|nr:hypothetical protein [Betaproteobacteria bacterium]